MRALVIGHDHIGGTGHLGDVLVAAGWELVTFTVVPEHRFTSPGIHVEFPDPVGYDLVIPLGAPWPRSAVATWAAAEVEFLAAVHRRGTPILGICAGAQFLAEALGGASAPLGSARVGWSDVEPHDAGVPRGPWFQWHSDRIAAPCDAEVLATSGDGTEAFRVGRSVGVQFHPEMSAALLDRWLALTPVGEERTADLRRDAVTHERTARRRAEAFLTGMRIV